MRTERVALGLTILNVVLLATFVAAGLRSFGSALAASPITGVTGASVNREGRVLGTARALASDLVIADVNILVPGPRGNPADVGAAPAMFS